MQFFVNSVPVCGDTVPLGVQGENLATQITADVSGWLDQWPDGQVIVRLIDANRQSHLADTVVDDGTLVWIVTAADTALGGYGVGVIELVQGDVVKKSEPFATRVITDPQASGEAPEPVPGWVEETIARMQAIESDAEDSANAAQTAAEQATAVLPQVETIITESLQQAKESGEFDGPPGPTGPQGETGEPGADGATFTPAVSSEGVISWTNNGGKTNPQPVNIKGPKGNPGTPGSPGQDGVSPTIAVTDITGGHRVTITDATGPHSFDVLDGDAADAPVQSVNGQTGAVVLDAQDVGAGTYSKPSGGIPASDLAAGVIPEVPVQDVQVNGTSILDAQGVANVPVATASTPGVVAVNASAGIDINPRINKLRISSANGGNIRSGTEAYKPIVPSNQHLATFYGLAKAAGDTTQSDIVFDGTYTDEAKVAIQKMLGIYEAPWELIREDTVTNETEADIEITVDGNGQAFELTDVLMVLIIPKHSEDTTIGDYGRIYLYNNTTEIRRIYLLNNASKLVQANSTPQIAIGRLLYNNGLMSVDFYQWTAQANRASLQIVPHTDINSVTTPFAINTNYIDKIKIGKITGQLQYRLFGRRKWN